MSGLNTVRLAGLATSLAVLLALMIPSTPAAAQDDNFEGSVSATIGWQSTSLNMNAGENFAVVATGSWTVDRRSIPLTSAGGYDRRTDPKIYQGCKFDASAPYAMLLGRVGNGPVIRIGLGGGFTASSSGDLQLRINDQDRCLVDNGDGVNVTVAPRTLVRPEQYNGLVQKCLALQGTQTHNCLDFLARLLFSQTRTTLLAYLPDLSDCLNSRNRESAPCQKLQEESGLPITF